MTSSLAAFKLPGSISSKPLRFIRNSGRLQIDCRQRTAKASLIEDVDIPPVPAKQRDKTHFQSRIKPGMFVRLNPGAVKFEGITMAMVMPSATAEDFTTEGDERRYICAMLGPSIMTDTYDLFVAKQDIYSVRDMAGEVLMEYDMTTRYYYMDL